MFAQFQTITIITTLRCQSCAHPQVPANQVHSLQNGRHSSGQDASVSWIRFVSSLGLLGLLGCARCGLCCLSSWPRLGPICDLQHRPWYFRLQPEPKHCKVRSWLPSPEVAETLSSLTTSRFRSRITSPDHEIPRVSQKIGGHQNEDRGPRGGRVPA